MAASTARLSPDLATRCQELLDTRARVLTKVVEYKECWQPFRDGHCFSFLSGWQDRTEMLYNLCAEADAQLGRR